MQTILIIAAILIVLAVMVVLNRIQNAKTVKLFRERLIKEFSIPLSADYSIDRMQSLSGYLKHHELSDIGIDDITWNDFDGDRLFKFINHSYSSIGDEYLYYWLHNPASSLEELDTTNFEKKIKRLTTDEELRLKLQILFARLGRTGKFSIYDYLDYLSDVKKKSLFSFIIVWIIYIAIFALIFVNPAAGIVALIAFAFIHIFVYLNDKKDVEPFFVSISYILRILLISKDIVEILPEEFSLEKESLTDLRKKLKNVNPIVSHIMKPTGGGDLANIIIDFFNILFSFDVFAFYIMYKEVMNHRDDIDEIITIMGKLDSEISVAAFRNSVPVWCNPQFNKTTGMKLTEVIHPLVESCVDNSFDIDKGMLLTGTNASGKSTFLRSVLISAVLAQTINTVTALEYQGDFYHIISSIEVKDNLENKDSYYMAEIKSIRRILEAGNGNHKVLCFVDELLRGTNTIERVSAASEIMKSMSKDNMLLFAATHDFELTELLKDYYLNFHFTEEVLDDDIVFSYKLKNGVATTRNAIRLLTLMGYPEEITENALNRAQNFIKTNRWE